MTAALTYPMPMPETITSLLADLLGKKVMANKGKPIAMAPGGAIAMCIFVEDETKNPVALLICDLAMAGFTGAALALIPPDAGKEAMHTKTLPPNIMENFHEVVNIVGAKVFNSPYTPHVSLREIIVAPSKLAGELKPLLTSPGAKLFIDVAIDGYGVGKLALLAASRS